MHKAGAREPEVKKGLFSCLGPGVRFPGREIFSHVCHFSLSTSLIFFLSCHFRDGDAVGCGALGAVRRAEADLVGAGLGWKKK